MNQTYAAVKAQLKTYIHVYRLLLNDFLYTTQRRK